MTKIDIAPNRISNNGCLLHNIPQNQPPADVTPQPRVYSLGELVESSAKMREPVIDGLLRIGETMNIIAPPKVGKSWLVTNLAFSVATGRDWLGFCTKPGKVLIIDNELHPETLTDRLRRVAEALGITWSCVADIIHVMPLRGHLTSLTDLRGFFDSQPPGAFRLVIIDAFYRALPAGTVENDNAQIAGIYNIIDYYADRLRGGFSLIHHSSKGNQAEKNITDVGSGAGSQSRAADSHLILRPHAEPDAVVLEAAVRSFQPVAPRCLRWAWPSFILAPELDPTKLRQTRKNNHRDKQIDAEPKRVPTPSWTAWRFAETFGTAKPLPRSIIIDNAINQKLSERECERLLRTAIDGELLFEIREKKKGKKISITNMRPEARKPARNRS